jgi:hypothetical protein
MDALPHLAKTDLGELHTKTSLGLAVAARTHAHPCLWQGPTCHRKPIAGCAKSRPRANLTARWNFRIFLASLLSSRSRPKAFENG